MNIVIMGSGNAATVLGRKFKQAGHTILQIYSRNASEASKLAYELDSESTNYKSLVNTSADVYLIAVSDDAIEEVADNLKLPGKVVAHTAASVPASVLQQVTPHYGVFYPLQSLRKEIEGSPVTPIYYDGHDDKARKKLEALAHSVSEERVARAGDEDRLKLHVAAVLVSNFTNHLYVLAENYCKKEGIDFTQLHPLIAETALRIQQVSPAQSQTGPAIRHDKDTIEKHIRLLEDHPHLKTIYLLLTESIQGS